MSTIRFSRPRLMAALVLLFVCGAPVLRPGVDSALAGPAEELNLENTVVVYSPHGKEMLTEFERRFEAAHPGVDVRWLDMGSQNVLDRVRSERANPQGDVWWGAPSALFTNAEKEDILQSYEPSWTTNIPAEFRSPTHKWYGTFKTPEVIAFNNQVLTEATAPQDWDDLLDPKWRNKIVIRYPLASGTMQTIFSAMIYRFYKASDSEEAGYEWLKKLDANTKSYAADPTLMFIRLARREGLVTLWNLPDIILQSRDNNYPFGYVIPKSGTPVLTDGIAIIKNCKHPLAARAFYEFVTSKTSLEHQAHKFYRIPTRQDIESARLPEWMQDLEIQALDIDWDLFARKMPEWMRHWDAQIRGK